MLLCTKHIQIWRAVTYSHSFLQKSSVGRESFDFLSALNTLHPLLLRHKLTAIQPDNAKVSWIIDYLIDRPQFVPFWSNILDLLLRRGAVLSPSLFTLYLFDLRLNCGSHHLQISLMFPPLWSASRKGGGMVGPVEMSVAHEYLWCWESIRVQSSQT